MLVSYLPFWPCIVQPSPHWLYLCHTDREVSLNMGKIIPDILWACGSLVHSLQRSFLWSKDDCLFPIIQASIRISPPQRGSPTIVFVVQLLSHISSVWPPGLWHARLLCPPLSPEVCTNLCPVSQWCHWTVSSSVTRFSSCLQSSPASGSFFSNELALCIRWLKYQSFTNSPFSEYSWLVFFRMDWFDLLAVQGTLKSLLQHHILKASIPWHSAFFMVQLSHPYTTTGKTIALTMWTFVSKVMSLLFNMVSRFVIAFLPATSLDKLTFTQLTVNHATLF